MTRTVQYVSAIVLLLGVAVPLQMWRDRGWQAYEPPTPLLWLRAGTATQKLALGFDNVLADLYWIRAVVYFGRQRLTADADKNYDLLYPYLELVTTLDPRFTVAYRFGAFFLSEPPPDGPGRPDLAIALLERGVAVSPGRWEYLHGIGFVHYWSYRDFQAAAEWLERAAAVPRAPIWLRSTAALMRSQAGDRESARLLWLQMADSTDDESLRNLATMRAAQFDALDAIDALNLAVWRHEARTGRFPRSWQELAAAGVVAGIPVDPAGVPYVLDPVNEDVRLAPQSPLWPLPAGLESSVH